MVCEVLGLAYNSAKMVLGDAVQWMLQWML